MKHIHKMGNRGEGLVENVTFILVAFFFIGLIFTIAPIFMQKQQLDNFAHELCRTAAVSGRIGEETNRRFQDLSSQTGLSPTVTWSGNDKIQLGNTITVTLQETENMKICGFGSYPIQLTSKSSEKSEVYWK